MVEPAPPTINVLSYGAYPRLGLPIIGAAVAEAGHDVLIYCEQLAPVDAPDVASADVVGISTTTSTAPAAYRLADELRASGVPVVIGGPHPTFVPEDALAHADFVARGEGGEGLMVELCEALAGKRDPEGIRGLSFWRGGRPVHNDLRERCADLDALPLPDLSLIVGSERIRDTPIITSLGCPFACTFCTVSMMFGRAYRTRSPENVLAELAARRPKSVFFYDDNFAADKRRLKKLLRMMIERDLTMPWLAQVRVDVARDEELLTLMHRAGCRRLALGFESVDQATLDGYAKSQTVEDIERAIRALHAHGIKVHGMFVLGSDTDTVGTARETVRFAEAHEIETIMLNVLTPALGTSQYEAMDAGSRIFEKRWQFYDGQHVVFTPNEMTPSELQRAFVDGYRRFYRLRRALRYLLRGRFGDLLAHLWGWWFIHRWPREPANRDYVAALDERDQGERRLDSGWQATTGPVAATRTPGSPPATAGARRESEGSRAAR